MTTTTSPTPTVVTPRSRRRWPVRGISANVALGFLLLYVLAALVGNRLLPYQPNQLDAGPRLQSPSGEHWFGTDGLGRDQFARVVAATRPALEAALLAVVFAIVVGTAIGIVAGFFGGKVDSLLSRIVDLLFAVPEYLLAILVLAALGSGLLNAAFAIGLVIIPRFARIARGSTIEIVGRSYIDAARLCGRSRTWIMLRHVLPNISSPLAIMAAINLSTVEGAYAALSFLGFGVRPPGADFGSMIAQAQQYLLTDGWLVAYPAMAFVGLVLCFIFLGDAMRDHLDPRSRTSAGA